MAARQGIAAEPASAAVPATPGVRVIDPLSDAAGLISALTLFAMIGIVCYDVGSRYLFNAPTTWVIEVSAYLFVAVVFLGLAAAQKANAHIQLEILLARLKPARRAEFELVAHWIALLFVGMTAWQMIRFTVSEYVYARLGGCSPRRSGFPRRRSASATSCSWPRSCAASTPCVRRARSRRSGSCQPRSRRRA